MEELTFRIAIAVLCLIAMPVAVYFRRRAATTSKERISRREEGFALMVLLRLSGLGLWLTVFAYVLNPSLIEWAALPLPEWVRWFGLGLSLVAVPLLVWMFASLGNNITDTVVTRARAQLVTHGPYRYVRHPLYTFGLLFFLGMGLMAANALFFVLGIVAYGLLMLRTPKEEARLIERFGDEYRSYMARTGRYVPRLFTRGNP